MAEEVAERRVEDRRPEEGRSSLPSTAKSGASALHRFLGGFPTAFFTLALITDYEYLQTANLMWQYFSIWLIVAALITGGLAVLAGVVDWATGPRGRRGFGWHFGLTILALLLGLLNAFVHSRDGWTAVVPEGTLLSLVVVILLYVGGFIGAILDRRPAVARTTSDAEYVA
ncbi:MAG: DUF2231 domain-containing protein [Sphingomicrobium sp.]